MDALNHVRAGEDEQVVVALQVARVVGEARAAIVVLGEAVLLDHRAHRTVEHEDSLAEQGREEARGGSGASGVLRKGQFITVSEFRDTSILSICYRSNRTLTRDSIDRCGEPRGRALHWWSRGRRRN